MKGTLLLATTLALLNVGGQCYSTQTPSLLGFLRSGAVINYGAVEVHHPEHGHEEHGHAEHGEHGHAEGGEHGHHELSAEEEALETESFSLALFLMGGVTALMWVFYLVNSPYYGVRVSTWRVLNMTASIFVAVLVYSTMKMLVLYIFNPGFEATIGITLSLFAILYIGTHGALFFLKNNLTDDPFRIQAVSTILAHMTGFAAMYGFADCQELEVFESREATGIIMLIVSAACIICLFAFVMDKVMKGVADADGEVSEEEEQWIDTCEETDDDVFCLATSFLIVLYFRFEIRGKVTPYEPGHVGSGINQAHSNYMLLLAFVFLAIVGAGTALLIKYQALLQGTNSLDKRITTNLQHLNAMIMAWCFLFWAEWQLYVWGWESTIIGGCLVVAVVLTMLSFCGVFVLNYAASFVSPEAKMAKRAMGSLELALGVLVGFSWERAFDVGFEEIEHTLKHKHMVESGMPAEVVVCVLSLVLLIIVGPAWRYYILPKVSLVEAQAKALKESDA